MITPMNGIAMSMGRRPVLSDRPDTVKDPTVAEIPSVPMSQLMV